MLDKQILKYCHEKPKGPPKKITFLFYITLNSCLYKLYLLWLQMSWNIVSVYNSRLIRRSSTNESPPDFPLMLQGSEPLNCCVCVCDSLCLCVCPFAWGTDPCQHVPNKSNPCCSLAARLRAINNWQFVAVITMWGFSRWPFPFSCEKQRRILILLDGVLIMQTLTMPLDPR